MGIQRKIADALVDFYTHRKKQKERVRALREKLDVTRAELRVRHFAASVAFCEDLDSALRRKTQIVEKELLVLEEMGRDNPGCLMTEELLIKVMRVISSLEQTITDQAEIPRIVTSEGKYQPRMVRARDIFIGNRALLEDMIVRVEGDTVKHATLELVARLSELSLSAKRIPTGVRRRELLDYEATLKNIGIFVHLVKKAHEHFCRVYPD